MNGQAEGGQAQPRPLPMTAGALLVNGTIYSHTSIRGDVKLAGCSSPTTRPNGSWEPRWMRRWRL